MAKKYEIEDGELVIEVPKDLQKQIISDHLEKYYIGSLTIGIFIVGFLLGIIAHAL
jgi:hypothetical protein